MIIGADIGGKVLFIGALPDGLFFVFLQGDKSSYG